MKIKYKRILLKLSGEYLGGGKGHGFDPEVIEDLSKRICKIHDLGVEVALVIGGGNIFRGARSVSMEMERVAADQMGMLATVINCLCLQEALERHGKKTRVMTSIKMEAVAEPFIKRRAIRHMEKGRIVIFGGGTGNPYFTTDTAAVLRGVEIKAEVVIKGTMVDGVYNKDPLKFSDATKWDFLTYDQVLEKNLQVMDSTAIAFCRDNSLPIFVLNISQAGNLTKCIAGEHVGTLVVNNSQ